MLLEKRSVQLGLYLKRRGGGHVLPFLLQNYLAPFPYDGLG